LIFDRMHRQKNINYFMKKIEIYINWRNRSEKKIGNLKGPTKHCWVLKKK